jgi:hypothetical protein
MEAQLSDVDESAAERVGETVRKVGHLGDGAAPFREGQLRADLAPTSLSKSLLLVKACLATPTWPSVVAGRVLPPARHRTPLVLCGLVACSDTERKA